MLRPDLELWGLGWEAGILEGLLQELGQGRGMPTQGKSSMSGGLGHWCWLARLGGAEAWVAETLPQT